MRKPVFLSSATQFWRKKVLEVANDHRDVTFAIADEQSFMEELKDFALDDSGEEVNVGCFDDKDKKYRMDPDEEFDEDSLRDFVENFKEGENSSFLVRNLFLKAPIQCVMIITLASYLHEQAGFRSFPFFSEVSKTRVNIREQGDRTTLCDYT